MFSRMLGFLGRNHRCRNTRLEFDVDRRPGQPDWLLIRMVDKCTGATYEATYSPATSRRILTNLADRVRQMHQM